MRSYVPWICASCMLLGLVSWGAKKALSHRAAVPATSGNGQSQLSLLPYKIIGNYVIEKEGAVAR